MTTTAVLRCIEDNHRQHQYLAMSHALCYMASRSKLPSPPLRWMTIYNDHRQPPCHGLPLRCRQKRRRQKRRHQSPVPAPVRESGAGRRVGRAPGDVSLGSGASTSAVSRPLLFGRARSPPCAVGGRGGHDRGANHPIFPFCASPSLGRRRGRNPSSREAPFGGREKAAGPPTVPYAAPPARPAALVAMNLLCPWRRVGPDRSASEWRR
jgi:hypothetical protein